MKPTSKPVLVPVPFREGGPLIKLRRPSLCFWFAIRFSDIKRVLFLFVSSSVKTFKNITGLDKFQDGCKLNIFLYCKISLCMILNFNRDMTAHW